ncbi:TPA: YbhB/YbcL family Raf kinase inhibitor-like protein [Candidatus Kaiserbacteria bacterium]|nr:YbhB/YbcL family Raf kinase inhibitor-like protein [Candidatus Kaiserbacteria bacterium]
MSLTSPAFEHNGTIPAKYTCDGNSELSPPLSISGVPEGAQSLVLIMDDPDVPRELKADGVFDHWTLFNIPPDTHEIPEGAIAGEAGANSSGAAGYTGPCPPPEYEPSEHRYVFALYALSGPLLRFAEIPTKRQVLSALEPLVLEKAELIGRYSRT